MAGELRVVDLWGSPFCVRVRIALREKGLKKIWTTKSPYWLLLQMNPVYKQVSVSESTIIVQYIDEVWNDKAPLLPSDRSNPTNVC